MEREAFSSVVLMSFARYARVTATVPLRFIEYYDFCIYRIWYVFDRIRPQQKSQQVKLIRLCVFAV